MFSSENQNMSGLQSRPPIDGAKLFGWDLFSSPVARHGLVRRVKHIFAYHFVFTVLFMFGRSFLAYSLSQIASHTDQEASGSPQDLTLFFAPI